MAAPVDANRATTNITSAASPWTVNLPAGIVAGDTLVMFTRTGGAQTIASVTGWTFLVDDDTSDASDDNTCVWYRKADGAEGSTVSVTLSGTAKGAAITYLITGAEDPGLRAPQISAVAVGTGANADPPLVTPAGILKDYLFIVLGGLDGETQTFTAPTNYSNLASANSGTAGIATTNVVIGSATRQLTAYSEDPGTFTSGAPSGGWTAYTIVIHSPTPTAVGGRHFPPGRLMPRKPLTEAMGSAVAQTFGQALTATVATSATMVRSAGKILSATVGSTATMVRQVVKTVSASVGTTATMVKSVGKSLTASVVTTVATLTASKVINVALTAVVATSATMARRVNKIVTATVATSASITKQVTKTLTATVATVASLTAIKVIILVLTATVGTAATMTRRVNKTLSASAATTATMVRQVGKTLTASVATSATMTRVKTAVKALTATVGTTATMTRQVGKTLVAGAVGTVATITKQVSKTLTATVSTVASLVADFISGVIAFTLGHFDEPTPAASQFDEPTPTAGQFDEPAPSSGHFDEPTPS